MANARPSASVQDGGVTAPTRSWSSSTAQIVASGWVSPVLDGTLMMISKRKRGSCGNLLTCVLDMPCRSPVGNHSLLSYGRVPWRLWLGEWSPPHTPTHPLVKCH